MPSATREQQFQDIEEILNRLRQQVLSLRGSRPIPSGTGIMELPTPPALYIDPGDLLASISGSIARSSAQYESIVDALRRGFAQTQAERLRQPTFLERLIGKRQEIAQSRPTAETYEEILAKFGATPEAFAKLRDLAAQLADYKKQISDLEAQKQAMLLSREQQYQGRLTDLLRGEQALVERQFNSRIAAKAAEAGVVQMQFQLEQGLIDEAKKLADKVIQFKIYDYEQRLSDLKFVKDIYTDMTEEEEKIWNKAFQMTKDARDFAYKKEKDTLDRLLKETELALSLSKEENKLLTSEEARKFGVPYGTRRREVFGITIPPGVSETKRLWIEAAAANTGKLTRRQLEESALRVGLSLADKDIKDTIERVRKRFNLREFLGF